MSKQFISTATAGKAHEADIYGVVVTKPYTITCSGDGYLKFWDNKVTETDSAKNFVKELFISKSGLHHIDVFEDIIDSIKILLVATVDFSGKIHFVLINDNDPILLNISINENTDAFWAIKFLKRGSLFAATSPTGFVKIWYFQLIDNLPIFEIKHKIESQLKSFATSLDLNYEKNLLATGYQNGDIILTNIETSKPVYTFHSFGLKNSNLNSSSVRSIKFSPLGTILAVASDSGSNGNITIYDTEYGENVGNFSVPSHSTQTLVGSSAHDGWIFEIDFNESGESLASCGYDGKVRVWNVATRERVATISLNSTDFENDDIINDEDNNVSSAFGVKYVPKGYRDGAGGDTNEGLVLISKDRGIRWYREAGGI